MFKKKFLFRVLNSPDYVVKEFKKCKYCVDYNLLKYRRSTLLAEKCEIKNHVKYKQKIIRPGKF